MTIRFRLFLEGRPVFDGVCADVQSTTAQYGDMDLVDGSGQILRSESSGQEITVNLLGVKSGTLTPPMVTPRERQYFPVVQGNRYRASDYEYSAPTWSPSFEELRDAMLAQKKPPKPRKPPLPPLYPAREILLEGND